MIARIREKFDQVVWGNLLYQYGAAGRYASYVLRYVVAVIRDMFAGGLMMRSMSLVYTTLLSVIPLLAFSFSVVKGLGLSNDLESLFLDFLGWMNLLEPLGEEATSEIVGQTVTMVERINFGVIGGVALSFFVYTAIAMVHKVEESFNYVWHVAKRRNFARRLVEYLVVLLIGPVVMVIAIGMLASLKSNRLVEIFLQWEVLGPVIVAGSKLTPYLLISGMFTFFYMYMPNTRVQFRAALLGGLAGGFGWATAALVFATFIATSARNQLVYASLALPITGLIWLYVNWLVLLIGAQLAFYFQNPAYLRIGRRQPRLSNSMRERLALNIMFVIGRSFRDGGARETVRSLAHRMKMPSVTILPIVEGLESRGLIVSTEEEDLVPAREVSRIEVNEILAVVRTQGETGSYRDPEWEPMISNLGNELDDAVNDAMGSSTLADLLDRAEAKT
ncbi:MAG: YihY/virulence factor BrkB family protein [Pseudomonadota bacterium]